MPPAPDPSLVHQVIAGPPATHAFVIGVGDYPHLRDGSGARLPDHQGLGQLSSPPVSARAIASWLIESFENPARPLASVRLLISEAQPSPFTNPKTGQAVDVARATIDHIDAAFKQWRSRGDEHEGNLLLFYFCGHGLGSGHMLALLAEDFGADPDNALDGAIDFYRLHLGMNRCKARQQCYLVDACRSDADMTRYSEDYAGRVLIQPSATAGTKERPTLYSTLQGEQAHGRAGEPSHFAEAVLAGLKGAGGDRSPGDWRVTTSSLQRAVEAHLARKVKARLASAQIPPASDLTTFDLHRLTKPPEVPVIVSCVPEEAAGSATLRCKTKGQTLDQRPPAPQPWEIVLRVGSYDFEAEFAAGASPYHAKTKPDEYVYPPEQKVNIEVES
jgi:Caspase domain